MRPERERKAELPPVFMASAKNHKRNAHDLTGSPRCHDGVCVWGGGKMSKCQACHILCGGGEDETTLLFVLLARFTYQISINSVCHLSDAQRKKEGGGQAGATFLLYVCKIEFGRDDLKRECQRCQHNISLERIHPSFFFFFFLSILFLRVLCANLIC